MAEASDDDLRRVSEQISPAVLETYLITADLLRAEGKAKGAVEGQADMLLDQLTFKFGPQPDSIHDRVHAATTAHLQTWAQRVLTAENLNDVLD